MVYYKGTLDGGKSIHKEPEIIYRVGLVEHPCPDKKSTDSCGVGIHLGKTLDFVRKGFPGAVEFYEVEAGLILGEDKDKIRVAYCWVIKQVEMSEVEKTEKQERERKQKEQAYQDWLKTWNLIYPPLCGDDWLKQHAGDFTWADYEKLGLELSVDGQHKTTVKSVVKKTDLKYLLKERMK